jgi:hypothetical protein
VSSAAILLCGAQRPVAPGLALALLAVLALPTGCPSPANRGHEPQASRPATDAELLGRGRVLPACTNVIARPTIWELVSIAGPPQSTEHPPDASAQTRRFCSRAPCYVGDAGVLAVAKAERALRNVADVDVDGVFRFASQPHCDPLHTIFQDLLVGPHWAALLDESHAHFEVYDGIKKERFEVPAVGLDDIRKAYRPQRVSDAIFFDVELKSGKRQTYPLRVPAHFPQHWIVEDHTLVGHLNLDGPGAVVHLDGRPPRALSHASTGEVTATFKHGDWLYVHQRSPTVWVVVPPAPASAFEYRPTRDEQMIRTAKGPVVFLPRQGFMRVEGAKRTSLIVRQPGHDLSGAPLAKDTRLERIRVSDDTSPLLVIERLRHETCAVEDRVHHVDLERGRVHTLAKGENVLRVHPGHAQDAWRWVEAPVDLEFVNVDF